MIITKINTPKTTKNDHNEAAINDRTTKNISRAGVC
jgi:hypothetical protein